MEVVSPELMSKIDKFMDCKLVRVCSVDFISNYLEIRFLMIIANKVDTHFDTIGR